MFELGILSNGKQSGFMVTRKQKSKAKDRFIEEPLIQRYIRTIRTKEKNKSKGE